MGYYRFLDTEQVRVSELVRSLANHCQTQVQERHVLAISDTSEINLQAHIGRIDGDGLGVLGNDRDLGFFIHPTLVLDGSCGFPLGISHVHLWCRSVEHLSKEARRYKELPIEEKESFKWLESAMGSARCLEAGGTSLVTHMGDREADIYEEWVRVPSRGHHGLIRACRGGLFPKLAAVFKRSRSDPGRTDPEATKPLSSRYLGLGSLADCPFRWMVWTPKPTTSRKQDTLQRITKV
jgi:hypothetical protein